MLTPVFFFSRNKILSSPMDGPPDFQHKYVYCCDLQPFPAKNVTQKGVQGSRLHRVSQTIALCCTYGAKPAIESFKDSSLF